MSKFYANPAPVGVTPPDDGDRKPVRKVVAGDSLTIATHVTLADGVTPATPENSRLEFALVDQRFSRAAVWTGRWHDGIEEDGEAGRVAVKVPDDVTATLRRGAFLYSLRVADKLGNNAHTPVSGSLLVEYEPTSPIHAIPYKPETET